MRRNKIMLLCIQETKLKGNDHIEIMAENPLLEVKCNNDPEGKAKSGIAFLLNKNLTRNKAITHDVIIPGRASRIIIQLSPTERLNVVNIYAPNIEKEKIKFYKALMRKLSVMEDMDDMIMMGDFNMINGSIDRLPQRKDDDRVVTPVEAIITKFHLKDGWRRYNEDNLDFTFTSMSNKSRARIDRIYIPKNDEKLYSEWRIETTLGISDHKLITVFKSKENTPYIGKGLWRMNHDLVEYEPFRSEVGPILMKLGKDLDRLGEGNTKTISPQTLWGKTKEKIVAIAKEKEKERKAQINRKRKVLMK
ncbi:Endonuclease/exonuclease/phosphatase, partial [Lentinula lateritia]